MEERKEGDTLFFQTMMGGGGFSILAQGAGSMKYTGWRIHGTTKRPRRFCFVKLGGFA